MKKKIEIPLQTRLAAVGEVNTKSRTVPIVWTTGAGVLRMDILGEKWIEELSTKPGAVRMGRMESGAPLLNSHNSLDIRGVIGIVESGRLKRGKGTAVVRFSKRTDVEPLSRDVIEKIIRNVS